MTAALRRFQHSPQLVPGRDGCLNPLFLALPPPGESASGLSLKPAAPAIALRSAGAAATGAGFAGTFRGGREGEKVLSYKPFTWTI